VLWQRAVQRLRHWTLRLVALADVNVAREDGNASAVADGAPAETPAGDAAAPSSLRDAWLEDVRRLSADAAERIAAYENGPPPSPSVSPSANGRPGAEVPSPWRALERRFTPPSAAEPRPEPAVDAETPTDAPSSREREAIDATASAEVGRKRRAESVPSSEQGQAERGRRRTHLPGRPLRQRRRQTEAGTPPTRARRRVEARPKEATAAEPPARKATAAPIEPPSTRERAPAKPSDPPTTRRRVRSRELPEKTARTNGRPRGTEVEPFRPAPRAAPAPVAPVAALPWPALSAADEAERSDSAWPELLEPEPVGDDVAIALRAAERAREVEREQLGTRWSA
jgi:hypothetical protein